MSMAGAKKIKATNAVQQLSGQQLESDKTGIVHVRNVERAKRKRNRCRRTGRPEIRTSLSRLLSRSVIVLDRFLPVACVFHGADLNYSIHLWPSTIQTRNK